jgi:hypothetical protein
VIYGKHHLTHPQWADTVKYETAYEWSAPLHFVDALDAPLSGQCSVSESRDCGNGQCILTAIANYTARVANTGLAATQRQEALKFIGMSVSHGAQTGANRVLQTTYAS